MINIRPIDMTVLDDLFDMNDGYVLNFSDRTFTRFFADELNIDIDDSAYAQNGSSKAKRLRCFLQMVDQPTIVRTLNALWESRRRCVSKDRRRRRPCKLLSFKTPRATGSRGQAAIRP
jgi:hypothetical protein